MTYHVPLLCPYELEGVPRGSDGKESAGSARDLGSIPGLRRSPGEGNGNPLQYSCLENPMDGGAWRVIVHGVAKSRTRRVASLSFHFMSLRMRPAQGRADLRNEEENNSGISFSNHRFIIYDVIMGDPASTQAWTWNLCSITSQQNLFVLKNSVWVFFLMSFVIRSLDHGNQTYVCPRTVNLNIL